MFLAAPRAAESRNIPSLPSGAPLSLVPFPRNMERGPLPHRKEQTGPGSHPPTTHTEETDRPRGDPGAPTRAGSRSTELSSGGPRWESAARTAPASGAAHPPAAAGPGSSPPWPFTWGEQMAEEAPAGQGPGLGLPRAPAVPTRARAAGRQARPLPPTDMLSCAGREMVRRGRPPCPLTRNPRRPGEGPSKVRCPPPLPLPSPHHRGFPGWGGGGEDS